jgi:hypothetical protein
MGNVPERVATTRSTAAKEANNDIIIDIHKHIKLNAMLIIDKQGCVGFTRYKTQLKETITETCIPCTRRLLEPI